MWFCLNGLQSTKIDVWPLFLIWCLILFEINQKGYSMTSFSITFTKSHFLLTKCNKYKIIFMHKVLQKIMHQQCLFLHINSMFLFVSKNKYSRLQVSPNIQTKIYKTLQQDFFKKCICYVPFYMWIRCCFFLFQSINI